VYVDGDNGNNNDSFIVTGDLYKPGAVGDTQNLLVFTDGTVAADTEWTLFTYATKNGNSDFSTVKLSGSTTGFTLTNGATSFKMKKS
jgi:hypothetical protein